MWNTKERRSWMLVLFIGSISLYASRTVLPICSVSLSSELQWNRQETGMVMGVFFWGYALTQFLAGYLSDRLGGERVIPCTSFVWSFLTLSFVYIPQISPDSATTFTLFVFIRFFLGVFQVGLNLRISTSEDTIMAFVAYAVGKLLNISPLTVISFYYPSLVSLMAKRVRSSERNFTHAVLNAGTHLGTLICGSLGSSLVANNGWRAPFAVIGLFGCFWALTVHFLMNPQRVKVSTSLIFPVQLSSSGLPILADQAEVKHLPNSEAVEIAKCPGVTQFSPTSKHKTKSDEIAVIRPLPWVVFLRHPSFWAMLFANFVHNNCFYIILNWCPSYFHDNYPDARSWVFNTFPWLVMFPSVLLGGMIADRWIAQDGRPAWFSNFSLVAVRIGKLLRFIGFHGLGSRVFGIPQQWCPFECARHCSSARWTDVWRHGNRWNTSRILRCLFSWLSIGNHPSLVAGVLSYCPDQCDWLVSLFTVRFLQATDLKTLKMVFLFDFAFLALFFTTV